ATHFRPSFHVLKTRQRCLYLIFADSPRISRYDHGQTVQQIKLADKRRLKLAPRLVLAKLSVADLPLRSRVSTESLESREKSFAKRFDYRAYVRTIPASDQSPVLRHEIHEAPK